MTDDIELLKECDAGVKMGIAGISQVRDSVSEPEFANLLNSYEDQHKKIGDIIHRKLDEVGETGKEPNAIGSAMSTMSTSMKLMVDSSDEKIADLMMDGCNMGIKSVSKYMNEYAGASQETKDIVDDIVILEQNFMNDLRRYL